MTAAGNALAAASGPSPLWYTTRATGAVALVLLTATLVLGIVGVTRFATPRWPRMITSGLHRNLSLLLVCFLAIHILTAMLDTYAPLGWTAVIVPFLSAYRPAWLGLGTVAFDLVIALVVTSLLRARMGRRSWRVVHGSAYAAWPIALWHGLGTGTDARLPVMLGIDAVCAVAVLAALWWRIAQAASPQRRLTAVAASAAVPVATIAFVAWGPLQRGWALRAGTPAALLGSGSSAAGVAAPGGQAGTASPAGLTAAALSGSISESGHEEGRVTVTITADTGGAARQHIVIVLRGVAADDGGVALSSGEVSVTGPATGSTYRGPVTALNGGVVAASLTGPRGDRVFVQITLRIDRSAVTGRLDVTPGSQA